jgi:hypothetical protein
MHTHRRSLAQELSHPASGLVRNGLCPLSRSVEPGASGADAEKVTEQDTATISPVDRAALAFSLLPTSAADVVNRRLSIGERMKLREGLSRVHNASDEERVVAVKMLAHAVRRGIEWPRPSVHDENDCPFTVIASHPTAQVIDVLERIAARDPLEVAVALCHLNEKVRDDLWPLLSSTSKSVVLPALDHVHEISTVRTRVFARDVTARLSREIRQNTRFGGLAS